MLNYLIPLLFIYGVASKDIEWCKEKRKGCLDNTCTNCCQEFHQNACSQRLKSTTAASISGGRGSSTAAPRSGRRGSSFLEQNSQLGGFEFLADLARPLPMPTSRRMAKPIVLKIHSREELLYVVEKKNEIKKALAKKFALNVTDAQVTDNSLYFAGDLLLTREQADKIADTLKTHPRRFKRKIVSDITKYWSTKVIYYTMDTATAGYYEAADVVRNAVKFWNDHTCLDFKEELMVENIPVEDYIIFVRKGGCGSYKGRIGGPQPVHIGNNCERFGVMAHELGHALGLWHEHQREDRDKYIKIDWDNVSPSKIDNFYMCKKGNDCRIDTPYDTGSVMHYHPWAFAVTMKKTIITLDPLHAFNIGSRRFGPSFYDVKQLNLAYNCTKCRRPSVQCQNDGYPNFRTNCTTCICPDGFEGDLCEWTNFGYPYECGGVVFASESWLTIESPNHPEPYPLFQNCTWLIQASGRRRIELQFEPDNFEMVDSIPCEWDFVEVRHQVDLANTGFRFCGPKAPKEVIVSAGQKMLVLFRSSDPQQDTKGFRAKFRIFKHKEISHPTKDKRPVFISQPSETVNVVGTGKLTCKAQFASKIQFKCDENWVDLSYHVTSEGSDVNVLEASIFWNKSSECECVAHSINEKVTTKSGKFKIKHSKIPYLNETFGAVPSPVRQRKGNPVLLTCEPPEGEPNPQITWERNGKTVNFPHMKVAQNGSLLISAAKIADSGKYACVAKNLAGQRRSPAVAVTISAAPSNNNKCLLFMRRLCVSNTGKCKVHPSSVKFAICKACRPCQHLNSPVSTTTAPKLHQTTTRHGSKCRSNLLQFCENAQGRCIAILGSPIFQTCQKCGKCVKLNDTCPVGWQKWTREGANSRLCYKEVTAPNRTKFAWVEAEQLCQSYRAHLPSFAKKTDADNFMEYLRFTVKRRFAWIGLKDRNKDGSPSGEVWTDGTQYDPGHERKPEFRWRSYQNPQGSENDKCSLLDARRRELRFITCTVLVPVVCQFKLS